mmetsp:Transcript_29617/g.60780  ORF Transcript_29617/g.60780 Transcript_29617/m.60780 type:complete len:213 (+) Transcript_29617:1359-1997(+)
MNILRLQQQAAAEQTHAQGSSVLHAAQVPFINPLHHLVDVRNEKHFKLSPFSILHTSIFNCSSTTCVHKYNIVFESLDNFLPHFRLSITLWWQWLGDPTVHAHDKDGTIKYEEGESTLPSTGTIFTIEPSQLANTEHNSLQASPKHLFGESTLPSCSTESTTSNYEAGESLGADVKQKSSSITTYIAGINNIEANLFRASVNNPPSSTKRAS